MAIKRTVTAFKHQQETLYADLGSPFERLHWRDRVKSDSEVSIKPNPKLPFFKSGVTKHERVVIATLAVL